MSLSRCKKDVQAALSTHGKKLFSAYMKMHIDILNTETEFEEDVSEDSVRAEVVEFVKLKLQNTKQSFAKKKDKHKALRLKTLLSKPVVKKLGLTYIAGKYHKHVITQANKSLESAEKNNEKFNGLLDEKVDQYSKRIEALECVEEIWRDAAKTVNKFVKKELDLPETLEEISELEEIDCE